MREPGLARPGAAGRHPRDSHPLCSRASRPAQPRYSGEPRSGKSFWISAFAGKQGVADTIIGNCTTTIPMKCDLHGKGAGHTVVVTRIRNGLSALLDALQRERVKADGAIGVVSAKRCSPRS